MKSTTKNLGFFMRVTPEQRELLQWAAKRDGVTMTEFVLNAARQKRSGFEKNKTR